MIQLKRCLTGAVLGGSAGFAYHVLLPCLGGKCAAERVAGVPILAGAFIGVMLVLSSKWD